MPSCAFRRCNNNSRNTNKAKGVTFHSFPQDPRFREKWIGIIQQGQRDEEWLPTQYSRICSSHFQDRDFYLTPLGRRKIKLHAIPATFLSTAASDGEEPRPGTPLHDVYVSDTDSIFDTPRKIHLKKQLRIEKKKKEKCRRDILNLKRQNKCLKSKNEHLRELVRSFKKQKYLNKESFDELTEKADDAEKDF